MQKYFYSFLSLCFLASVTLHRPFEFVLAGVPMKMKLSPASMQLLFIIFTSVWHC